MSEDFDERRLWSMLGRLALQGYVVPPDEGQALIDEFHVEAWPGLTRRYDPGRGSFVSYALAAFYRFARRRILQARAWRVRLVETKVLAQQVSAEPDPGELLERQEQIGAVGRALDRLPAAERRVLHDFLVAADATERALADRHRLTRHGLRETLTDALGRVATELGQLPAGAGADAPVASALWQEGRNVRDTAAVLGLSAAQVQAARKRIVARMLAALRGRQTGKPE